MNLKQYLATYAEPGPKGTVRGVAEWLEEEARAEHRAATDDNGRNVTAAHLLTAAKRLWDQLAECWQ